MGFKHCNIDGRSLSISRGTLLKINLNWSHSMRSSWSVNELFSLPSYLHYMHTSSVQTCPNRWNMYILFYEQAVCKRGWKYKKFYLIMLDCKMAIIVLALFYNCRARDVSTVQRTQGKKNENGFLRFSCDSPLSTQGTSQPSKESIIFIQWNQQMGWNLYTEMHKSVLLPFRFRELTKKLSWWIFDKNWVF